MTTRNRGKQSSDDKWFAPKWHPIFSDAVNDLCYFYTRGYAENSAIQIVGNRYKLNKRQRNAISRISCSNQGIKIRNQSECKTSDLNNQMVEIDGFNLLIILESALSGAFIFKGRDGVYRDISSVHGSYKFVSKTKAVIILVGNVLNKLNVKSVKWYFDSPISNSGRLKTRLLEIAKEHGFNWEVELVFNPDKVLVQSKNIVVSSDGWIIENTCKWFNLSALLIETYVMDACVIEV